MVKILKDYPNISLKTEELDKKIDFEKVFGRSGFIHIEIGSGKGTFLLNQAKAAPNENFLGIEWANKYYRHAVDRIGRWAIKNVRIIRAEATSFIAEFVPAESVDCFHIYFPDPWPKKRHNKRRFFNNTNLESMIRCLRRGGRINIATDHEDYFQQIEKFVSYAGDKLKKVEFLPTAGANTGEWVGTNFERKYIRDNRNIYTLALIKV